MNEEERVVDFDIKTKEGEILYHKTVTLQGLELFKEVIDLKTPTIDLGLYLDGVLYEKAGLREVAFIAGIDTSHENYYLSELSPTSAFLNLLGGEIVPIKGSLNASKIGNCSWLIVPLPPSDAMMPSFTVLTLKDVELLTDYTKRGGNFIFILSEKGSPEKVLESFEHFIQEVGIEVTFAESGLRIEGTKRLFETSSGSRFLFLTWEEATDSELSKEILSTYRFLWETEP
jgi:hypothetical protein